MHHNNGTGMRFYISNMRYHWKVLIIKLINFIKVCGREQSDAGLNGDGGHILQQGFLLLIEDTTFKVR